MLRCNKSLCLRTVILLVLGNAMTTGIALIGYRVHAFTAGETATWIGATFGFWTLMTGIVIAKEHLSSKEIIIGDSQK